jgi:colanic acid/amylovoran biosynthesis glycosyltransferase
MPCNVLHLVRKNSQLNASFIYNQIIHHKLYSPFIAYRKTVTKNHDGGFAVFSSENHTILDLGRDEKTYEKILFSTVKMLSKKQVTATKDFIVANKIDICHFHYGSDCGIFYPLQKYLTIPSVVSFYGYDSSSFPEYFFRYGGRYLRNRVFNRVDAVLAMSPDMKKDLMKAGCPEEKIIVHYYGTDCSGFYQERKYFNKEKINLLILASLVPQKGHVFLLHGIKKLVESGITNFMLRIIGTGELEQQLKKTVISLGITGFVSFIGAVRYGSPEMMTEYQNADIFIHPSVIASNGDKEGIPGTIVEAMAAGLPVISTFHAGIPYIIENEKTGILVEEWDTQALAYSMKRLIEDCTLRESLGKAGQSYAMANLDLIEKEKELENIYIQLQNKRP